MNYILKQVIVIVCIVIIVLLCYVFRSNLGLSDKESIAGITLLMSIAILFITVNLIAEKVIKLKQGQSTTPINIASAVVSAGIIMLFHEQITNLWEALFKLL